MNQTRVLSGVQPTGSLHIGNWLGAIRNWVGLQNDFETFFCVVDLHAITVPHDPKKLLEDIRNTAAIYLACGIDPSKCSIFIQSQVPAHSELCWLLNCVTPLNWLERMIQFKEKSHKFGDNVSAGLLNYPILMAADILLYDADLVPVGEDQKQHLELARNIAQQRINSVYGKKDKPILKVPKPLIHKEGSRIMSLIDGNSKMSKSDPNQASRINILDTPEAIIKKIKRAKTDSYLGLEFDNVLRPEANNLLSIYSAITGKGKLLASEECAEMSWGTFKPRLAEAVISALEPIQMRYNSFLKERSLLDEILENGRTKAELVANTTLTRVRKALGFAS